MDGALRSSGTDRVMLRYTPKKFNETELCPLSSAQVLHPDMVTNNQLRSNAGGFFDRIYHLLGDTFVCQGAGGEGFMRICQTIQQNFSSILIYQ